MGSMCQSPESTPPKLAKQTPQAGNLMRDLFQWIQNPSSGPQGVSGPAATFNEATTTGFAPQIYDSATRFLHETAIPDILEQIGSRAPGVGSGLINAETRAAGDIGTQAAMTGTQNRMQGATQQSNMLQQLLHAFTSLQPQLYQPTYGPPPIMQLLSPILQGGSQALGAWAMG